MKGTKQSHRAGSDNTAAHVQQALRDASEPRTSAQLAAATGLKPAVVRHHLRQMRDAGNATTTSAATMGGTRGRPAARWVTRSNPDPGLLARLSRELARALAPDADAAHVRQQLRRLGADIAATSTTDDPPIIESLDRLGFAPRTVETSGKTTCIELRSCPFVDPDNGLADTSICGVHAQLAAGMTPPGTVIDLLEINPFGIGCRLHLRPTRHRNPRTRLKLLDEA